MSERVLCCCCGRFAPGSSPRVGDGRQMHFDCWTEHHSDPTGVWPTDHVCADKETR